MTRTEAQVAFSEGKKISHKYFLPSEYIVLDSKNNMVDETGQKLNKIDFWLSRGGNRFDSGWFIIN